MEFYLLFQVVTVISLFLIPLFIALGFSYFSHKILVHVRGHFTKGNEEIPYLQRLLVAFISVLLPSIICVACIYLIFFVLIVLI